MAMSFTTRIRDELARTPTRDDCCRLAETAALLRLAGAVELRGGQDHILGVRVDTTNAAVARRLLTALRTMGGRAHVEAHRAGGLRSRPTYRIRFQGPTELLARTGVVDPESRPRRDPPVWLTERSCDATAYLRGALMASGRCSDPRQRPHLEIGAASESTAAHLAGVLRRAGADGARVFTQHDGWRVVVKAGQDIGTLLARAGAHDAFLAWDQTRLRQELRAAANRVANADRANLRRAVGAAARQIRAIERLMGTEAWNELTDELRATALTRLANPEASLTELGRLLDPPAPKVTLHRRLERIVERADACDVPGQDR